MGQKDNKSKRDLDREGLEIYLVHFLMAARPWFIVSGSLLLVYGAAISRISSLTAIIALGLAALLFLTAVSFEFLLWIAKVGAWIGSISRKVD
jgi:hypothetical protein